MKITGQNATKLEQLMWKNTNELHKDNGNEVRDSFTTMRSYVIETQKTTMKITQDKLNKTRANEIKHL